jgi:ATP-dependent RNA helicase DDX18/HAS1
MSQKSFIDLGVPEAIAAVLSAQGIDSPFPIQVDTLPDTLAGRDVLGRGKTGSGKTLAFSIPMVARLAGKRGNADRKPRGLVLAPTRELAMQNYKWARDLLQYHSKTHGVVIGGAKRSSEAHMLKKGVNLLVATPGRLLDHLQNTPGFVFHNLQMLIIDEADAILKIGFEEEMN